jgi:hypothetical protein
MADVLPTYHGVPRTVFFTVAAGDYKQFVLPYMFTVLYYNMDAYVEIVVDDERFIAQNEMALRFLRTNFGDRIRLSAREIDQRDSASLRFLMTPETLSEYVYIGDVDFLILEGNITDIHLANSIKLGLPYSNVVRPGTRRLSGLHFTRRDAYYPVEPLPPSFVKDAIDEEMLYEMVRRKGHGMPTGRFRPGHGIHFSPKRELVIPEGDTPTWGLTEYLWRLYKELRSTSEWQGFRGFFDPAYSRLLDKLDSAGLAMWG